MSGIYIHIPYCRQACSYCNFHFSVSWRNQPEFLEALKSEIGMQRHFFDDCLPENGPIDIDTVYFGGGTPSTLSVNYLLSIINKLDECFDLGNVVEFTLEANPDDLTVDFLSHLKKTPINRLSIGIQSFHKNDLIYMNRVHTPDQAFKSLVNAQRAGFKNLSVDLIYGTPSMSDSMWIENLRVVTNSKVPHVSAYALTVEPKTPLEFYIRKGRVDVVRDEQISRQFEIMTGFLQAEGYLHYEISNFALPGHISKHNVAYWQGKPYLGIGPSAHSYRHNQRSWNIANTSEYIDSINKNRLPVKMEILSKAQTFNEYVMTSLRTMWGCNLSLVEQKWEKNFYDRLIKAASKYLKKGMMVEGSGSLVLTDSGKLFADGIAADLFVD